MVKFPKLPSISIWEVLTLELIFTITLTLSSALGSVLAGALRFCSHCNVFFKQVLGKRLDALKVQKGAMKVPIGATKRQKIGMRFRFFCWFGASTNCNAPAN